MSREFYIDWKHDTLFGYQKRVSDLMVESFIISIKLNDKFDPVSVFKLNDKRYILSWDMGGGHTRAVSHYIENQPLLAVPGTDLREIVKSYNIKDIEIVDDAILGHRYKYAILKDPRIRLVAPSIM